MSMAISTVQNMAFNSGKRRSKELLVVKFLIISFWIIEIKVHVQSSKIFQETWRVLQLYCSFQTQCALVKIVVILWKQEVSFMLYSILSFNFTYNYCQKKLVHGRKKEIASTIQ